LFTPMCLCHQTV